MENNQHSTGFSVEDMRHWLEASNKQFEAEGYYLTRVRFQRHTDPNTGAQRTEVLMDYYEIPKTPAHTGKNP